MNYLYPNEIGLRDIKNTLEGYFGHSMMDGITRYVKDKKPPGDFLYSLLSNDLFNASFRADDFNKKLLYHYIYYFYNYLPPDCWGSPEKVAYWANNHK